MHSTTLISTDLLASEPDRLPKLDFVPKLEKQTSQGEFFRDYTGASGGTSTNRFDLNDERQFEILTELGEGILTYYSTHWNFDWKKIAGDYAVRIRDRALTNASYSQQSQYVKLLVNMARPWNHMLCPEGYDFHCSTVFPCRDQILHMGVLNVVGSRVLSSGAFPDRKLRVSQVIRDRIVKSPRLAPILPDLYKAGLEAELSRLPRTRQGAEMEQRITRDIGSGDWTQINPKQWDQIISDAWEFTTALHEIGRCPHAHRVSLIDEDLPVSKEQADLLAKSSQTGLADNDHGEIGCVNLIRGNYKQHLSLHKVISFAIATNAIQDEVKLLKSNTGSMNERVAEPETWHLNPMGAFLATMLLLSEYPARICWHSIKGQRLCSEEPWDASDVQSYMPVGSMSLIIDDDAADAGIVLERSLGEYPEGAEWHTKPISPDRVSVLGRALGPNCLGLLSRTQSDGFDANWQDREPHPSASAVAGQGSSQPSPHTVSEASLDAATVSSRHETISALKAILGKTKNILDELEAWPHDGIVIEAELRSRKLAGHLNRLVDECKTMIDREWADGIATFGRLLEEWKDVIPVSMRHLAPDLWEQAKASGDAVSSIVPPGQPGA